MFEDEISALQTEVDKLKTLNVNKIIALGHSGFEMDKLIAQKVKGVDVVVGGHSNTFLYTGNFFLGTKDSCLNNYFVSFVFVTLYLYCYLKYVSCIICYHIIHICKLDNIQEHF